jgi:3,8-divinyl chlorophyllide a/chlorophyllide a reductase subunit X
MILDWRRRMTLDVPNLKDFDARLRAEAAEEPTLEVPAGPATKKTQIIAIYGKGGIGKSFTLANLSLHDGRNGQARAADRLRPEVRHHQPCCSAARPARRSSKPRPARNWRARKWQIGDVCFKRNGVFAMELGGPEVGRGCGGRGIIHGFELLEKLGFHDWDFDYVLLDFLGDVVCGGFRPADRAGHGAEGDPGRPRTTCSRSMWPTTSARRWNTSASWAAMSVSRALSSTRMTAPARRGLRRRRCIPILAAIPQDDDLRKKSANYQIVGTHAKASGALFAELAEAVGEAPRRSARNRCRQDGLLGLFDSKDTGGDVVL